MLKFRTQVSRPTWHWGFGFFLFLQTTAGLCQTPTFKAEVDSRSLTPGRPFEVSFILEGAEGRQFTPPVFRDFKPSGGVSESRGFSIVNGRTSVKQIWSYTLEPLSTGTFSIGPATVMVNGKQLSTKPITLSVQENTQTFKGGGIPNGKLEEVFITGELNRTKAYPGQQVIWRLMLYTKVAIEGADLISLPDFEGFYSKERKRFDTRVQYQTIRGAKYAVKTLHEECIFPQQTGEITIKAAQIRVGIEQPGTQGFLFGPKPVTLNTAPVVLTVEDLPQPVPAGFSGGVGTFTWEVSADTSVLTTDDALTITVALTGNGDARRFGPPKFEAPAGCEIFQPRILEEETYENMEQLMFSKKLEYVLLPKDPGNYAFTPSMTFFDPDSNKYRTLSAAAIQIQVSAGKNYTPNPIDTTTVPLQITTSTGLLQKAARWLLNPWLWGGVGLTLMFAGLLVWLKRRPKKEKIIAHEPIHMPKAPGIDSLLQIEKIASLEHQTNTPGFYLELLKGIQIYLATKLNLSTAELNHEVVTQKLVAKGVTPIRTQALLSVWQKCEMAVYAGQIGQFDSTADWNAAHTILREIEKELK
ncbi:MAG: protein BatD [Saprospiraceae bacterium]|nr:protein BatD [Saprospiraceae bacterium]